MSAEVSGAHAITIPQENVTVTAAKMEAETACFPFVRNVVNHTVSGKWKIIEDENFQGQSACSSCTGRFAGLGLFFGSVFAAATSFVAMPCLHSDPRPWAGPPVIKQIHIAADYLAGTAAFSVCNVACSVCSLVGVIFHPGIYFRKS